MNSFLKNLFGIYKDDQEIGALDNSQDGAISWEPTPPRSNDALNIHYRGLLKDAGASEIFLHYGFDSWKGQINTTKMDKMADGSFSAAIKADMAHEMNLCFKDNADNWDNNSGNNWNLILK
jgi:hypothetical protein